MVVRATELLVNTYAMLPLSEPTNIWIKNSSIREGSKQQEHGRRAVAWVEGGIYICGKVTIAGTAYITGFGVPF